MAKRQKAPRYITQNMLNRCTAAAIVVLHAPFISTDCSEKSRKRKSRARARAIIIIYRIRGSRSIREPEFPSRRASLIPTLESRAARLYLNRINADGTLFIRNKRIPEISASARRSKIARRQRGRKRARCDDPPFFPCFSFPFSPSLSTLLSSNHCARGSRAKRLARPLSRAIDSITASCRREGREAKNTIFSKQAAHARATSNTPGVPLRPGLNTSLKKTVVNCPRRGNALRGRASRSRSR